MFCSKKQTLKICVIYDKTPTLILEGICDQNSSSLLEKYLNELINKGYLEIAIDARKLDTNEIKCYSIVSKANQVMQRNGGKLRVIKYDDKMHKALNIIKSNKFGLSA